MSNRANNMLAAWIVLLSVLFVGLKLGNVIPWNWAWVLSPIWAPNVAALLWATVQVVTEKVQGWRGKRKMRYRPRHAKKGWLAC